MEVKEILKNSNSNWHTLDAVIRNLEEKGFIITEVSNLEKEKGLLMYSKDKTIKVININKDLNESKKVNVLIDEYAYYNLNCYKEKYGFIYHFNNKTDNVTKKEIISFRNELMEESILDSYQKVK